MFEIGQQVEVITDKGIAYEATIFARAKDDSGLAAYKVVPRGLGPEQLGQWHKACDVFLPEQSEEEQQTLLDKVLND